MTLAAGLGIGDWANLQTVHRIKSLDSHLLQLLNRYLINADFLHLRQ